MIFKPSISNGQTISNQQIVSEFRCGNMGGMRRSNVTNSLVLITDHTKLYDDKWYGDVLHYTGMGKSGDQSLNFMQNKTLSESNNTGISVFLFEVFEEKNYFFHGRVTLIDTPYQSNQLGEDGADRKVWIFPIKVMDNT